MSKPKFVTLKQIASALEVAECSVRRNADKLGITPARDKVFKNRFLASKVQRALRDRDYDVCF